MKKCNRGIIISIIALIVSFLILVATVCYVLLQINGASFSFGDIFSGRISLSERGLDSVPENLRGNVFFTNKKSGYLEELKGDVEVCLIHVSTPGNQFSSEEASLTEKRLRGSLNFVSDSAKEFGVELGFTLKDYWVHVDYEINEGKVNKTVLEKIAEDAFGMEMDRYQKKTRSPIIFMIPEKGRSYAHSANDHPVAEYIVLFDDNEFDLAHEILHLYGAKDFYYPQEVKLEAIEHFSESIMFNGDNIDNLTAFLIGWVDSLSKKSTAFIIGTMGVTRADIVGGAEASIYTGFGSVEFYDGIYTGNLLNGAPHGHGEYNYNSGDRYEGEFLNGKYDGFGTYVSKYGEYYSGEFYKGLRHGYGTQYDSLGRAVYIGEWYSGAHHGSGIEYRYYTSNPQRSADWVYEGAFYYGAATGQARLYYFGSRTAQEGYFLRGKLIKGRIYDTDTGETRRVGGE